MSTFACIVQQLSKKREKSSFLVFSLLCWLQLCQRLLSFLLLNSQAQKKEKNNEEEKLKMDIEWWEWRKKKEMKNWKEMGTKNGKYMKKNKAKLSETQKENKKKKKIVAGGGELVEGKRKKGKKMTRSDVPLWASGRTREESPLLVAE